LGQALADRVSACFSFASTVNRHRVFTATQSAT
jgi:hypothetical protein